MKVLRVFCRILYGLVATAYFLACAVFLAVPVLKTVKLDETYYECVWDDGSCTVESYLTAYACLVGVDDGDILLYRGGMYGRIYSATVQEQGAILRQGKLGELLKEGVTSYGRLEAAALFRGFAQTLYYANGEYFRYTGEEINRVNRTQAQRLSLLSGAITANSVRAIGATEIYLHKEAQITGKTLVGTAVSEFAAEEPYSFSAGALYLETPAGKRLAAALPTARALFIDDVAFCDEGALLACGLIEEISVPYVGFAPAGDEGETLLFARLFSDGVRYGVPQSLAKITVRGGQLASHAFYACNNVTEITACGVACGNVSRTAFADCSALRILHAPRGDILLPFAKFAKTQAPCGCTVYERGDAV